MTDLAGCVELLLRAYDDHVAIDPPRSLVADLDLDGAYRIQLAQVDRWLSQGRQVRGHKVGLTSRAMQEQLGVDQPDYGHLMDDMFIPESTEAPIGRFLQPRAEPEIAFVLESSLRGPGLHVGDVLRAVAYVVPALEIIDSRIRDWDIGLVDTIADNASSGAVVLGGRATPVHALDLRLVGCTLLQNGRFRESGTGAAVLGNPVNAVAWLANTLGVLGVTLEAGSVILPGACTRAIPFTAADSVTAVFDQLGSVSVAFGDA